MTSLIDSVCGVSIAARRDHFLCRASLAFLWRFGGPLMLALSACGCASQPKPVPQHQWSVERLVEWQGRPVAELSLGGIAWKARAPRRYSYLEPSVEPVRGTEQGEVVALDPDGGCYVERRADGTHWVLTSAQALPGPDQMDCSINVLLACRKREILLACDGALYRREAVGWTMLRRSASPVPYLLLSLPSSVMVAYQVIGTSTWDSSIVAAYARPDLEHTEQEYREVLVPPVSSWQRVGETVWMITRRHPSHLVRSLLLVNGSPFTEQEVLLELPTSRMSAFHVDRSGKVWIGGLNEVRRTKRAVTKDLKLKSREWVEVAKDLNRWDEVLIRVIKPSASGTVWLGTEQNGVIVLRDGRVDRWIPTRTPATERIFPPELYPPRKTNP